MSKTTKYEEARTDFIKWHRERPEVWELFEGACWKAIEKGHRSAKVSTVMGAIVWKIFISLEEEISPPQQAGAFYARMWIKKNPEFPLFRLRDMDGEARWKTEHTQQRELFQAS